MAWMKTLLFTYCATIIMSWGTPVEASNSDEGCSPENLESMLSSPVIQETISQTISMKSSEMTPISTHSPLITAKCVNYQSLLLSASLKNFSRIEKAFLFDLGHLPSGILLRPGVEDYIGGDQLIERLASYDYRTFSNSLLRGEILPLLSFLKDDFLTLARWLYGDYEKLILSYREKLDPRKNVQLHGFQLSISLLQKVQSFAETYNSELVSFIAVLENGEGLDPTVLLGLQTAPVVLQELMTDYHERVNLLIRSPRDEDIGGEKLDKVVRKIKVKRNSKKLEKQPCPSEEEIAKAVGEKHISPRYVNKKTKRGTKVTPTHPSDKEKDQEKADAFLDSSQFVNPTIKRITEVNHLSPRPELQRTSSASKLLRRIKGVSHTSPAPLQTESIQDQAPPKKTKGFPLSLFQRATDGSPRRTPPSSPSSASSTPKVSSPLASPSRQGLSEEANSSRPLSVPTLQELTTAGPVPGAVPPAGSSKSRDEDEQF